MQIFTTSGEKVGTTFVAGNAIGGRFALVAAPNDRYIIVRNTNASRITCTVP